MRSLIIYNALTKEIISVQEVPGQIFQTLNSTKSYSVEDTEVQKQMFSSYGYDITKIEEFEQYNNLLS